MCRFVHAALYLYDPLKLKFWVEILTWMTLHPVMLKVKYHKYLSLPHIKRLINEQITFLPLLNTNMAKESGACPWSIESHETLRRGIFLDTSSRLYLANPEYLAGKIRLFLSLL